MTLAPVTTTGSVQTTLLHRREADGDTETTVQAAGTTAIESYIWHPWFARVSADLSLAYDKTAGSEDSGSALRGSGSATLAVLPQSPYPVTLNLAHIDSRVSGDFAAQDFIRDRAALTARASFSQNRKGGMNASWERTDEVGSGVRSSADANFDLSRTFSREEAFLGISRIGIGGGVRLANFRASVPDEEDDDLQRAIMRVEIGSEPWKDVVVDSRTIGLYETYDEGADSQRRLSLQGLSTLQWRPKDLPFTVTGTLRTLYEDIEEVTDGRPLVSRTSLATGTLGMRWPLSDRLNVNLGLRAAYEDVMRDAGAELGERDIAPGRRVEIGVLAGADYTSDTHPLGGFDWRWTAGAQTENGIDTENGFDTREFIRLGHEVAREIDGIFFVPLTLTMAQDGELRLDSEDEDDFVTLGLSHSLALSYSHADRDTTAFGRVFLRDSRDVLGSGREFQNAQVRFGQRTAFDRDRRLQGNFTAQLTREVEPGEEEDFFFSASGELTFDHRDLFGVDNLGFRSTLRINLIDADELFGTRREETSSSEAFRNDWRNVLSYAIGRLVAETELTGFQRDDGFGYLILFRLRRDFGGDE